MAVLVQKQAPDFTCAAVGPDGAIIDSFRFHAALEGKYGLLVFYPLDFTFVCPTELIALDHRVAEFTSKGVEVLTVSIDSQFTHSAWRNTPVDQGGIGPVKFTMLADIRHEICQAYDVQTADGVALRAAFIIDKSGIVRAQLVNDLPLGRNIDELIRLVDALQFSEEHGEVCPAGWNKGDAGMTATADGVASYLKSNAESL
ncbi:MAG: peroxiredoxin [Nannocystaceae bacterium]|nr:peroxiredoxin [Nannocystaceae bacterium]